MLNLVILIQKNIMEVSQYNNLNDIYGNWKVKYKADAKTITAIFFFFAAGSARLS